MVFFVFLLTARSFEEDSLFRVVDDDQLFISVAEKRRWSSASFYLFRLINGKMETPLTQKHG